MYIYIYMHKHKQTHPHTNTHKHTRTNTHAQTHCRHKHVQTSKLRQSDFIANSVIAANFVLQRYQKCLRRETATDRLKISKIDPI